MTMDPDLREEDLYALLGVEPDADRARIEAAYSRATRAYAHTRLAAYSLFGDEERQALADRIERAYRILIDPEKRRAYDAQRAGSPPAPERAPERPPPDPAPAVPPLPMGEEPPPLPTPPIEPERFLIQGRPTQKAHYSGGVLRRIRESRGLSLREMSASTKVTKHYLAAIEENRFDALPPLVYLKGYLTAYLRELGLDRPEIVQSYLELLELHQAAAREKKRWFGA